MRKISEYLRDTRESQGLTLEQAEKSTKIKQEFLKLLESGEFRKLPSESYALGFVKNYAVFLKLNPEKASAMFRREYESEKIHFVPSYKKKEHLLQKRLKNAPKIGIGVAVVLIVFIYLGFQYSSFFLGPKLEITDPKNGSIVTTNKVEVKGKTNPYATVVVEDEEVRVELDGTFEKDVFVFTGKKEILVISKNRFGKSTKKTVQITVETKQ
ncbi:MAG: helix-turn-helix domain-containing protein [Candidatus Levybacteria bacterium]|nr:helix-turn-helix domain-containing protein [Candidatus Levybacteria bacterium]